MKIAVVGAGAMGRWAVKELGISSEVDEIVVGDYDEAQAKAVAESMGGGKATGVFVDAREMKRLNREYRGKDYATDVLSFEAAEPDSLGELVMCLSVLRAQSLRTGLTPRAWREMRRAAP